MLLTERERLREELLQLIDQIGRDRSALLPLLQEVQRHYFHISEYCMQVIADLLDIHPVEVHSVVSFYRFLDEHPQGQFVIRLCRTVTCDMAGQRARRPAVEERLADRLRPDHARRQVLAGLGELPGDVRSGAGDAGQRTDLHAGHAGEGTRHPGRVPADVRCPRHQLAQERRI